MYAISFDDDVSFLNLFLPYMISKDVLDEKFSEMSLFKLVLISEDLREKFINTLQLLCNTDDIKIDTDTLEIYFNNYTESLNENNFEEFSEIVLEMIQAKKLVKEVVKEPVFKTEDGRKRWLILQENRRKAKAKEKSTELYDIINIVQFGMNCYISDNEIKQWTYWKLIKSYLTIINKKNYEYSFEIYLQCGEKSLIETHWSELIKL